MEKPYPHVYVVIQSSSSWISYLLLLAFYPPLKGPHTNHLSFYPHLQSCFFSFNMICVYNNAFKSQTQVINKDASRFQLY